MYFEESPPPKQSGRIKEFSHSPAPSSIRTPSTRYSPSPCGTSSPLKTPNAQLLSPHPSTPSTNFSGAVSLRSVMTNGNKNAENQRSRKISFECYPTPLQKALSTFNPRTETGTRSMTVPLESFPSPMKKALSNFNPPTRFRTSRAIRKTSFRRSHSQFRLNSAPWSRQKLPTPTMAPVTHTTGHSHKNQSTELERKCKWQQNKIHQLTRQVNQMKMYGPHVEVEPEPNSNDGFQFSGPDESIQTSKKPLMDVLSSVVSRMVINNLEQAEEKARREQQNSWNYSWN